MTTESAKIMFPLEVDEDGFPPLHPSLSMHERTKYSVPEVCDHQASPKPTTG